MIQHIDVSARTVVVGQPIDITIYAAAPITVRMSCFVNRPPPPRYAGCAECSTYTVNSGEQFTIIPDAATWSKKQGGYEFTVSDATGETQKFRVNVTVDTSSGSEAFQVLTG